MENHGILNWRTWSLVRKSAVLGAIAGAGGTIAVSLAGFLSSLFGSNGDIPDMGLLFKLTVLTFWPAEKIFSLLGLTFWPSNQGGPIDFVRVYASTIAVNAALVSLVATVVAWVVKNGDKGQKGDHAV